VFGFRWLITGQHGHSGKHKYAVEDESRHDKAAIMVDKRMPPCHHPRRRWRLPGVRFFVRVVGFFAFGVAEQEE
jgi:hypothetical protein